MSAKPTIGSYDYEPNLHGTGFYITAEKRRIAEVYERLAGLNRDEAEANAKMLAASADTFSAMFIMLTELDRGGVVSEDAIKLGREALRKAGCTASAAVE
jgi:hypothetical protein